jgi:chromate transporter
LETDKNYAPADGAETVSVTAEEARPSSLREFLLYFLRLGALGFGGPIALAGYMQRDLVENRSWISRRDYMEGLALAQLAPGPLAAQLAIYLGWVRAGSLGATLVSAAFVLPSFLMVLVISILYVRLGGLPWIQAAFYGIGAAVIAVIVRSAFKLARLALRRDWLLWTIALVNALVTGWTESELVWVFLLSGIIATAIGAWPTRWRLRSHLASVILPAVVVAGVANPASAGLLWDVFWFFTKAGAFVFGSGLAIVPFLHGGVVGGFRWLTERQFLDAVAVAMVTPGPVVITVAFIGYLVAGVWGAILASIGVFLPCYLFVIFPAPYFRRFNENRQLRAFVNGVTAAATGAIGGAAWVLAKRAITDGPTFLIASITLAVLLTLKELPEPLVILAAGIVGVLLFKGVR